MINNRCKNASVVREFNASSEVQKLKSLGLSTDFTIGDHALELSSLDVQVNARGNGYASQALKILISLADKYSITLELEVMDSAGINTPAWYMRHGFKWCDGYMQRQPIK